MIKVLQFRFQQCLVRLHGASGRVHWNGTLEICLTTFFGVCNFGNTSAMRVVFFFENDKNLICISKMQKQIRKMLSFWDNCIWIGCLKLCLLKRKYLPSAVSVLRNIVNTRVSLREIFSNFTTFTLINKYSRGGVVQISTLFGRIYIWFSEVCSERGLFTDLIDHVFRSP